MAKFLGWSSGQATWSGGQDVGVVPKGLEWWPRVLLGAPRADRLEVYLPPQKRLCIAQGPRYEVGESSSTPRPTRGFRTDYGFVATLDAKIRRDLERDVSYGITDTWDEILVGMSGAPATDDTELGRRMTEFATMVRQDTNE
ncbi:hypothetical protein Tco_0731322, partial [Tanacetum coccineum]